MSGENAASSPPRTLTLLVVRHGITEWNAQGRLQGQTDIPLSPEGRAQARALGRRLARAWRTSSEHTTLPGPPVAAYASDLSRARETAEIVLTECAESLGAMTVRANPLLRERGFGEWEGLTAEEARVRFGTQRSYRAEGEPHAEVWKRMEKALNQIWTETAAESSSRHPTVLLVGHGGSLRQLVCLVNGLEIDAVPRFHLDNTGLSILEITEQAKGGAIGRIKLWNDTAHLTYEMD